MHAGSLGTLCQSLAAELLPPLPPPLPQFPFSLHPRETTSTVGCFTLLRAGLASRTKAGILLKARFIQKRHNLISGDKKFQQDLAGKCPQSGVDIPGKGRENPTPCKSAGVCTKIPVSWHNTRSLLLLPSPGSSESFNW